MTYSSYCNKCYDEKYGDGKMRCSVPECNWKRKEANVCCLERCHTGAMEAHLAGHKAEREAIKTIIIALEKDGFGSVEILESIEERLMMDEKKTT